MDVFQCTLLATISELYPAACVEGCINHFYGAATRRSPSPRAESRRDEVIIYICVKLGLAVRELARHHLPLILLQFALLTPPFDSTLSTYLSRSFALITPRLVHLPFASGPGGRRQERVLRRRLRVRLIIYPLGRSAFRHRVRLSAFSSRDAIIQPG